jgi:hypothetical protein
MGVTAGGWLESITRTWAYGVAGEEREIEVVVVVEDLSISQSIGV